MKVGRCNLELPYTFLESMSIIEHCYAFGFLGTYQSMPWQGFKHTVPRINLHAGSLRPFCCCTASCSSSSSPHLRPPLAAEGTENRTVSSASSFTTSMVLHRIFATSESFADIKGPATFGYVCLYSRHCYAWQPFWILSLPSSSSSFCSFLPSIVAFFETQ